MRSDRKTPTLVLGTVAVALGAIVVFSMYSFGGIMTALLGVLAIASAPGGRRGGVLIAGVAFLAGTFLTLVRMSGSLNELGGRARTVLMMLGVGLLALAVSPEATDGAG